MQDPTPCELPDNSALNAQRLDELDDMLDELRTRGDEIPQWEFCDGFLTALVCMRREVPVAEWLPMLLGDGGLLEATPGQSLPLLEVFKEQAQQDRFLELFTLRMDEVRKQLDQDVQTLDDERCFQPEAMDMRGAMLTLPEAEQAEVEGEVPSFGQIWALGFMFAVENWPEEWAAPRDKEAAGWIDDSLNAIVALTEDDTGKPEICMYEDGGPASTSHDRLERFGEAIWAVYDLRQIWKSLGPRQETIVKGDQPGRNDACSCGSGKKFKRCCGG
ncbi:YecA/YgfB family protein [Comamonas composti]|uniref:YecA/YgfB family protein n=1 Tax=Comamonas composti TaxID=408558 RepID=UPI0003F5CEA1|nr:YecA family protein [Comamonas composti]